MPNIPLLPATWRKQHLPAIILLASSLLFTVMLAWFNTNWEVKTYQSDDGFKPLFLKAYSCAPFFC